MCNVFVNGKWCDEEPIICKRDLHLVGYQDTYSEDNRDILELRKKVWAPCSNWRYYCFNHRNLGEAQFFDIGELCPHGSTPQERGIPVPNMPLVGKEAIVLETDL